MSKEQSNKPQVLSDPKTKTALEKLESGVRDANNLVREKKVDV